MSKIKDAHNVLVPWSILGNKELTSNDKVVYSYMKFRYQFFKYKGLSYRESNLTISKAVGLSRTTVVKSIATLVEHKLIRKISFGGSSNHYELITKKVKVVDTLIIDDNGDSLPF